MNKTRLLATVALLAFTAIAPRALAQSTPAAQAARQQKLLAAQAAARARAAAAASAAPATTATSAPTAAPTTAATVTKPVPTATPSAAATVAPPKATASAAPATSGSAAPVASAVHPDATAIALDIDALRKSRPDRRHAEFLDMQSRWGNLLSDPRSTDELKLHAQRLAYLQRIRALGAKDPAFVKTVDALITKEETRNSNALNALRSGALPTATPAVAAAVAAPTPAAGATK
ncbi:MAG: hypothetical protein WDO69_19935 [Pseudomonadota bacterium]